MVYAVNAKSEFLKLSRKFTQNIHYISNLSKSILLEAKAVKNDNTTHELCNTSKNLLSPVIQKEMSPKFTVPYVKSLDCLGELTEDKTLESLLFESHITNINF
jgi:hypothetical protein